MVASRETIQNHRGVMYKFKSQRSRMECSPPVLLWKSEVMEIKPACNIWMSEMYNGVLLKQRSNFFFQRRGGGRGPEEPRGRGSVKLNCITNGYDGKDPEIGSDHVPGVVPGWG